MIVRQDGDRTLLITQPDHAALAARIMRAWKANGIGASGRRSDILMAIEEHDNGWREADQAPMLEAGTGKILDFVTAPDSVRRGVWPLGIKRLAGTYGAALVAQHALHIYRRYKGEDAWDPFFAEMEKAREHHLSAAGIRHLDDLKRDYRFLRLADLASLTFCAGWTEPQTDDSGSGYTMRLSGNRLHIHPDPFEGAEIALSIPARRMPGTAFSSEADAQQAWIDAERVELTGIAGN